MTDESAYEVTELPMTWKQLAVLEPQLVQLIVQKCGPLPEGNVKKADYDRFIKQIQSQE